MSLWNLTCLIVPESLLCPFYGKGCDGTGHLSSISTMCLTLHPPHFRCTFTPQISPIWCVIVWIQRSGKICSDSCGKLSELIFFEKKRARVQIKIFLTPEPMHSTTKLLIICLGCWGWKIILSFFARKIYKHLIVTFSKCRMSLGTCFFAQGLRTLSVSECATGSPGTC